MTGPGSPSEAGPLDGHREHQDAIRLQDPRFADDPGRSYAVMRKRHGPVVPILLGDGVPAWYVLGYREARMVAASPQMFGRDSRRWNGGGTSAAAASLPPCLSWNPSVLFTEDDEHRRRARAISDALDAVDRTDLTAVCERAADHLIDAFSGDGTADLVAQFAHPLPMLVIGRMFGVTGDGAPALAGDIATSLGDGTAASEAHARVQAQLRRLVLGRHIRPGPDLPSRLLAHPAGLSDDEIVSDLQVVLAVAQQPTGDWIGNALRLMLVDGDFSVSLQGGRTSAAHALNEVLWRDTPVRNVIGRWAVHDCELGGRRIRRGDLMVLGLAAANSDPAIRPDPAATPGVNRAHLSFGLGEYACPSPAPELAEVIARTAVEVLLDRIPDTELAVPADSLKWRPSLWMHGLAALPVRFTPTAPGSARPAQAARRLP